MADSRDVLRVKILGIDFRNPVLTASGTFGYGIEFASLVDLNSIGGIIVKGLSRHQYREIPRLDCGRRLPE